MRSSRSGRTLAAVLFTDIVGSTSIADELGDRRWKALVDRHHRLVRRELKRFAGREQDTAGDGFFAAFNEPASAIACACAIADAVRELGIEIRAGVHFGECERIGPKLGGITVAVGARIMSLGGAGDVLVSSTSTELARGAGFTTSDRGTYTLKGIEGRWAVLSVDAVDGERRHAPLDPAEATVRRAAIVPEGRVGRARLPFVAAAAVLALAAGAWVVVAATGGADGVVPGPDTLARVASSGDAFDTVFELGDAAFPYGLAAGGGRLWVVNVANRTLLEVDPTEGEGQVLGTPSVPTGVAFGDGRVWVTYGFSDDPLRRLDALDPDDPVLAAAGIEVADGSYPIATGHDAVWIADPLGSTVLRYEPVTGVTTTIELPDGTAPIALGTHEASSHLWIASGRSPSVYRVEVDDPEAPPERFGTGGDVPSALAVAPNGSVWIVERDADSVVALSPSGTTLVDASIGQRCDGPSGVLATDASVWVSCSYSSNVLELRADGSIGAALPVDGDPGPIALDETGAVWVATRRS
jgi:class 3 adenylate cyclase/streptogramin lyase